MVRTLDVFLRDQKIGELQQDDAANLSFSYDVDYLTQESNQAISVSMPLSDANFGTAIAKPYFAGLLPDESARKRLAAALGISDTNAFGMLEIIGGECAGAMALHPQGADRHSPPSEDEILDSQQLAELLEELRGNPLLGGRQDVRLSLAGAQDKIAVKVVEGRVAIVKNGEPTTHILKPSIQGLEGTAQNETFCMSLAARLGIDAPAVQCARAGDTDYILVERFDRNPSGNSGVQRLHQEDFCQALSVPPELKYEEEGGPGIHQSLDLINRVVARPAADRLTFLRMQIFHYLVGNADAHAKNFALLYSLDTKAPSLSPIYDVVCTASYPELTKRMAMKVGGRNLPDTIKLQHWHQILPETKASQRLLSKELKNLATRIVDEAEILFKHADELGCQHAILKDIVKIIKTRSAMVIRCLS